MNLLKSMFKNGNFQDAVFSRLAEQAREKGIKKILVEITDDGKFNTEIIPEEKTAVILNDDEQVVKKTTFEFLKNFYNENKLSSAKRD